MTIASQQPGPTNPALRWVLLVTGCIAVGLGVLGIFLPVLPTVPFLLLALACFTRSSARFHRWLLDHDQLGPLIRPYLDGRGMTRASKLKAITLIWASIGISVLVLLSTPWIQALLLMVAAGVSLYLLRLPTIEVDCQGDGNV